MHLYIAKPDEFPLGSFHSFVVVAEDAEDAWRCMIGASDLDGDMLKNQNWMLHKVVADLTEEQRQALATASTWAQPEAPGSFVVTYSYVSEE